MPGRALDRLDVLPETERVLTRVGELPTANGTSKAIWIRVGSDAATQEGSPLDALEAVIGWLSFDWFDWLLKELRELGLGADVEELAEMGLVQLDVLR